MADITKNEMTREEAETTNRLIKHYVKNARTLLLEMRDRKGYLALGYSSFDEYGQKEHGYGQAYVYRLAAAAEIQAQIDDSPIGENSEDIPESQLRPLSKVDPESRPEVWQAAQERADTENGGKMTAKIVSEEAEKWRAENLELKQRNTDLHKTIVELAKEGDALKAKLEARPEPTVIEKVVEKTVEVVPADYDALKTKAAKLGELKDDLAAANEALAKLKAEQARKVEDGIRQGLRQRQADIEEFERRKVDLERMIETRIQRLSEFDAERTANAEAAKALSTFALAVGALSAELMGLEISALHPDVAAQLSRVDALLIEALEFITKLRALPSVDAAHALDLAA